jgi:tripartite-type tricarboxylate transporter receptor subunit TctC
MKNILIVFFLSLAALAHAQDYPSKPIRLIVPFAAGGASDTVGRIVGQKLGERLGQQVVVDNRTGAGGSIGAEAVARAAPDGHTLLLGSTSEVTVYPSLNPKAPYDTLRDFAPVSLLGNSPFVLVVHPAVPAKSVQELVALARSRPGALNYSSAGTGSTTHLAVEMLALAGGVRMTHVPYKGSVPAVTDLVAGRVELCMSTMPAALPFVRDGRLRALGISSARRSATLPDVPTIREAGLADYDTGLWNGILAPAGTPAAVVSRLHRELAAAMGDAQLRDVLSKQGADAMATTPEEFSALIRADLARWTRVVREAGVRLD